MFNAKDEEIRELLVENNELWQENTTVKNKLFKQQQRIDKAIEYIKNEYDEENYSYVPKKRLLEILGGDSDGM